MAGECILVEQSEGVATLTMNGPEQLNAMSYQLSTELHEAVMRMSADDQAGCIVITGAGNRAFSAGGDIHEQIIEIGSGSEDRIPYPPPSERIGDIAGLVNEAD